MSAETYGGMASDASKLVEVIRKEGERWSAGTWSSGVIAPQLLSAIAVAVQRSNAMAMLVGYTRTSQMGRAR